MFASLRRRYYTKLPLVHGYRVPHIDRIPSYNCKTCIKHCQKKKENTRSILRAQSKQRDTAEQLTKKAKMIFGSIEQKMAIRSTFTLPKQCIFSPATTIPKDQMCTISDQ